MKLHIKNMVCDRCKTAVRHELEKLGWHPQSVTLGGVELEREPDAAQHKEISNRLRALGFELLDDPKEKTVESIKNAIIEMVHYQDNEPLKFNYSDYIARKVGRDYGYLSSLFSESEGVTIEKHIISQKVERAKELLLYGELSLGEIADLLKYSSVQHLSNQFKKVTGLTPGQFKHLPENRRKALDRV